MVGGAGKEVIYKLAAPEYSLHTWQETDLPGQQKSIGYTCTESRLVEDSIKMETTKGPSKPLNPLGNNKLSQIGYGK